METIYNDELDRILEDAIQSVIENATLTPDPNYKWWEEDQEKDGE